MSAKALRTATDAAQRDWIEAVARVVARWSGDVAGLESAEEAFGVLRRMLDRETVLASEHGAGAVDRILRAAGIDPSGGAQADIRAPRNLYRTLRQEWQAAEHQPDPVRARTAALARIIDVSLTDAWRDGTHAALVAEPSVIGWRPVSRAGCCGACLARADGRIRPLTERLWEHPFGRCFAEPVVADVNEQGPGRPTGRERWEHMTGAEQDEMFYGRGGAMKADLIRSGHVALEDLVAWQPRDPDHTNHRQLPREATLRELTLDEGGRAALTHRTGIEFGVEAPDAPAAPDPADLDDAFTAQRLWLRQPPHQARLREWQATDRAYENVQAVLRAGAEPDAATRETIDTLSDALGRGALPHRTRLYRGVRSIERTFGTADVDQLLGDHHLDGFVATSVDRDVALREFATARGALLEIDAPRGTPAVWVAGAGERRLRYQGEMLLGHATKVRVVAVRREGDLPVLSCEVIE